jgi:peptidoglycan/LPS O-acetylase OafA/YrhL
MRIDKLDGLRGIFSLMVVLHHFGAEMIPTAVFENFFIRESYTFVDFFFVLSGFVIAYNYHTLSSFTAFVSYIKKRFVRLFPLLFFTINIFLAMYLVKDLFGSGMQESFDFQGYFDALLFMNSTPVLGSSFGINPPSWSISSEMISYIVFGLISILAVHKRRPLLLGGIILAGMAFSIYSGFFFFGADYGFIRGLVCFNTGYFVWLINQKSFKIPDGIELIIPFLIGGLLYLLFELDVNGVTKQMVGMVLIPLTFGASILILLKSNGLLSRLLNTAPSKFLGKVSYSVYLNHWFFIFFMSKVYVTLGIPNTPLFQTLSLILTLILLVIYSYFTYTLIERKSGSYLKKLIFRPELSTNQ